MRDNALAVALRRQGHDAILVPLYLPMMLDEPTSTEDAPLFYGGVNVYLQQTSSLFRKTPAWLDRLLDSPAVLKQAAARAGMTKPEELGSITLSMLQGENGNQLKELDRLIEWLNSDGKADVVCLSNALLMGMATRIKEKTKAQVVCTLQGEDYFLESLPEKDRVLCWQELAKKAQSVDTFIAVSQYYGEQMQRLAQLPAERVRVVFNGIDLKGYPTAPHPLSLDPPTIGYLARLNPLKGLHTLIDAYLLLRQKGTIPDVRLRVAGTKNSADDAYIESQKARLIEAGLEAFVEFLPNLPRESKIEFLKSLSVLSVPATYGESFGLYLLEAWAVGVPVVQPRHAAFPEILAATGGGILCAPDDPEALASAWEALLSDPNRLRDLGQRGFEAVHRSFSIDTMAAEFLRALSAKGA
jgi:glycosyltransferase involved in cell wall biosynthesis